jgi:hypothetical protein
MDKTAHGVGTDQPHKPENNENDSKRPKHGGILLVMFWKP